MKWWEYETAYGKALDVPHYLRALFSKDEETRLDAAHQLCCGLSHQHAYIASAALPAYPFLKSNLSVLDDELKADLLDILRGLALCTRKDYYEHAKTHMQAWEKQLREHMLKDLPMYRELRHHPHELISAFAEDVILSLLSDGNS